MSKFSFITISLDSSELDTDSQGLAEAIQEAGGSLIEDVYAEWIPDDSDDDDDYRPPNYGQITQPIEITFTQEVTMEQLEEILEKVDMDSFGFGNGWDVQQ